MAIEKLSVILELVSGNYKKEAKEAADATGRIGGAAASATGSLRAMVGPAAIGAAVVGLGNMALKAGENADRLFDLAAQTGLSTDALQRWEFVAKVAGTSTEVFSDAVKAIIKNLSDAEGATGAAGKAYETLGINVKDASGNLRDAGAITEEVFDKLAGMENITARNALAQDIFGKKWEETISILDLGSEALAKMKDEASGGIVSAQSLKASDQFRATWAKFTATIGPKMNELLGKAAPLFTSVAESMSDALDELQPLLDALGFLAERWQQLQDQGDEMAASDNIIVSGWGRMISELGILDVLTGNYTGSVQGLIAPTAELGDAATETSSEIHDSWTTLGAAEVALRAQIGPTIAMLDNQNASHRNVAAAADTQRKAMINLFTAQADLLDPLRSVILLQRESAEANKRLAEAQKSSKTTAEEMALAIIEAEQAELRLNAATAGLTADQIQAFAQILTTELGYSEKAALDLLEALGLLDGTVVNAKVVVTMDTNASGTSGTKGTGNINSLFDEFGFASGGVIPGPLGSQQLVLAHGGETITPPGKSVGGGTTIVVQSPMGNFRQDLQYATILASVTNLVEGF